MALPRERSLISWVKRDIPAIRDNLKRSDTGTYMDSHRSKRVVIACLAALVPAMAACGDSDDNGTNPTGPRGDFSVATVTTGVELDPDRYEIRVNDIFASLIGVNDLVEFVNRAVDTYTVELAEVAANCVVSGDNPRFIQVIADTSIVTTFEVTCAATAGVLQVATITTGENPDDAYSLEVDGADAGMIGANDVARTADLQTGEHTVRLGDIALNCTLVGDPARTVVVPSEDMVETRYEVLCTDQVGDVRLVTSTTGLFPDPDGYEILISHADPIPVESTGVRTVGSVAAGVAHVRLLESSLADQCSVDGENQRTVTVPAGGLVETTFEVTCGTP